MEYRNLGRSGLVVSEVSVGSWLTLGSSVDRAGTREIVHRAFDLGVNLFDTADVYSNGAGEEALGYALRDIPRRYVVIATKCFFPMSERPNDRGLSRKHIHESLEDSLRRIGTDYVDLLQCHRYDPNTPVAETVSAFDDLVRQGKVLYWGVSEWRADQIVDACRCADALRAVRPISNQPQYNALRREIEREVMPVSRREGLSQIAYSPLAQGALTGKYSGGRRPSGTRAADGVRNMFMNQFLDAAMLARTDRLAPLAAELGISMAQLALAWCLAEPNVASVITGVTRLAQLEDNVKASGLRLPPEILEQIDAIAPGPGR
ncbi:MAG TPA: aldo/keto reductase family protein [Myxococcota bacterium]|nr:aldo/keto reductase family protein [Myxococcota bacterium]